MIYALSRSSCTSPLQKPLACLLPRLNSCAKQAYISVKPGTQVFSAVRRPGTVSPAVQLVSAAPSLRPFVAAAANTTPDSSMAKEEVATLGGGCFWCTETCFNQLKGVHAAVSGYAGGHVPNPTYQQVCAKDTGHAEVVQIKYDPAVIDYRTLLEVFFYVHDPTTKDRQGNDVGPQYRSVVFYHNEGQKKVAEEVMEQITQEKWWPAPLVTELAPLSTFYPAEDYHQRYYENNPTQGYCAFVVRPKVAKFREKYAKLLAPSAQA